MQVFVTDIRVDEELPNGFRRLVCTTVCNGCPYYDREIIISPLDYNNIVLYGWYYG